MQRFSWVFSPPQRRNFLIMLLLSGDRLLTWWQIRNIPVSNCDLNSFPLIVALASWTIWYNLYSPFFLQEKSLKSITIAQLEMVTYRSRDCLLYFYTDILKWFNRVSVIIRFNPSQIKTGCLEGTKMICSFLFTIKLKKTLHFILKRTLTGRSFSWRSALIDDNYVSHTDYKSKQRDQTIFSFLYHLFAS